MKKVSPLLVMACLVPTANLGMKLTKKRPHFAQRTQLQRISLNGVAVKPNRITSHTVSKRYMSQQADKRSPKIAETKLTLLDRRLMFRECVWLPIGFVGGSTLGSVVGATSCMLMAGALVGAPSLLMIGIGTLSSDSLLENLQAGASIGVMGGAFGGFFIGLHYGGEWGKSKAHEKIKKKTKKELAKRTQHE